MHAKRIDPEMIGVFRIARRDMPSHALVVAEASEQTKGSSEALFAMAPFFLNRRELGRHGSLQGLNGCRGHGARIQDFRYPLNSTARKEDRPASRTVQHFRMNEVTS